MYYYLDKEDGYSKGPFTWEELKRLPLSPETYIFDQQKAEWQTLAQYHHKMAAEAKAAVKRAPRPYVPEPEPEPVSYKPAPLPPLPRPTPQPQSFPAPAKPFNKRQPMPPYQPGQNTETPMGISGIGCFIWALVIALVFGLIFGVMWWQ